MKYLVKLNHWTTGVTIHGESFVEAADKALAMFPTCDCCDEPTAVESVEIGY